MEINEATTETARLLWIFDRFFNCLNTRHTFQKLVAMRDCIPVFSDVNEIPLGSQELFSDNEEICLKKNSLYCDVVEDDLFSQGMQLSVLYFKHT